MAQRLPELVEELTTSGEPQLNAGKMKELKKLCKSSVEQLGHTYHLLKAQLSQEHAQVRLSTFQVMEQLFARSHHFRTLLVSDFQEFLELTLGTNHSQPLPPPQEVARQLRQAALRAVKDWTAQYGAAYKKLDLGYHFLRHSKQVNFQDMDARTPAERRRDEARQRRLDQIHQDRAQQAAGRMEEMFTEIQCCLTELDSCFELLLPFDLAGASHTAENKLEPQEEEQPCCSRSLSEADHPAAAPGASSEDDESDQDEFVRCHGLGSHKYTLQVDLSTDGLRVQEDEDNAAIIHSARDALKLIQNKFLPAVCSWVQVFTRAGVQGGSLQKAISLKVELEKALRRGRELAIEPQELRQHQMATTGDTDEDDDDEDFVEVLEKEGYEAHIPHHLWAEYGLEEKPAAQGSAARTRTSREEEEACDPTTAAAQLHHRPRHPPSTPRALSTPPASPKPEETGRLAERARAPVVPFGVDLCYWEQEQPPVGKILRADSEHRFWKPSEVEPEVDSATVAETLRTRRITFAGTFEPVQHRCRAPRPDGRLCERQDRLKCPFHGKIIPRDDTGQPLREEDRVREQQQQLQKQAERPDWKDPAFLRDVEAATGVDLGSSLCGKGKGKGKKRKHPGLTDLRQQTNTPRTRIAKKVFAKKAMQRVVAAMNQMDQKKHEKFANQFNYALK